MYTADNHSFVICAYKVNPHLEMTIQSLLNQTVKSRIYISTSTPNEHIRGLCKKYQIELFVNPSPKNAGADWNWGYDHVPTTLVTIAHQDDYYEPDFLEKTLKYVSNKDDFVLAFTDYYEIRNGQKIMQNKILKVKRLLLSPFKKEKWQSSKFIKRRVLSVGCPICCPAATYNKKNAGSTIFDTKYINSCDYETWCNLAELPGKFIYIDKPLLGHRIYEESATSKNLSENIRKKEDFEILCRYWPKWIANIINSVYATSEKSNEL